MTGNKNLAREAGQYFSSFQEGNLMKKYFMSLLGPIGAFEKVEYVSRSFTNYTEYKVKRLSSSSVEVAVYIRGGVKEKPYQCENRIGMLEAVPMLFNPKIPRIEHTECFFKGGKICRYIVSWENTIATRAKRIETFFVPSLGIVNLTSVFFIPRLPAITFFPFRYSAPSSSMHWLNGARLQN